jgi:hypothetical protein
MDELKPCAYTHVEKDLGHKTYVYKNENDLWRAGCNCGYRGPVMATPEQAIRAHNELIDLRNTRATPTDDQCRAPERDAGLPTNYDVSLALKISRYLHDLWPDAPHDIGIGVAEIVWLNNGQGT